MVVHAFNPSTWEAEEGRFLSSRPTWAIEWVPGQPRLHKETRSQKKKKQKKKKRKRKKRRRWLSGKDPLLWKQKDLSSHLPHTCRTACGYSNTRVRWWKNTDSASLAQTVWSSNRSCLKNASTDAHMGVYSCIQRTPPPHTHTHGGGGGRESYSKCIYS